MRALSIRFLFFCLTFSLVVGSFAPLSVFAEEQLPLIPDVARGIMPHGPAGLPSASVNPELSSCFDFYRFGSTPIIFSGDLSQTAQGATISFSGKITNQNAYPIVGATVYAKIYKQPADPARKDVNGPYVMDFFPAVENITLKAGEAKPISFLWKVPQGAEPGAYEAALFVVQDGRFDLLGLSFTNDIVGAFFNFSVVGENKGAIQFDKNHVAVNGVPYRFAAFIPTVPKGVTQVPVTATVENTTDTSINTTVSWKLYFWDGVRKEALLDQSTSPLKVHPHATSTVTYVVKDTSHSVYYLQGEFTTADGAKSVIDVRFNRADVFQPRINDAGVMAYPLDEGTIAYACFHSGSTGPADNVRIELSVTTAGLFGFLGETTIASKSYNGTAPGNLVAISTPVSKASSAFTVHVKLYQDGKTVDEVSIPYSCSDLGGTCQNPLVPLASVLGAIIAFALLFVLARGRRSLTPASSANQTGPMQ